MEPGSNRSLSSAENFHNPNDLESQGFKLQVPLLNGTFLPWKKISFPCSSVIGKFHCIWVQCEEKANIKIAWLEQTSSLNLIGCVVGIYTYWHMQMHTCTHRTHNTCSLPSALIHKCPYIVWSFKNGMSFQLQHCPL